MNGTAHDHSQWGAADQIGAANLLTAERRLAALGLVREARVYDVSHTIAAGAPYMAPNQTPYLLSIFASWRDSLKRRRKLGLTNDAGGNLERIEMTTHVGTHIDALGHFTKGDRLYNGFDANETVTDWGLERLGIEQMPPMVTRGVLLDVAGLDGGAHLAPGPRRHAGRSRPRRGGRRGAHRRRRRRADPHRLGPLFRRRQRALPRRRARHRRRRRRAG